MARAAYAYIRKSSVTTQQRKDDRTLSAEVQEAEVRAYAKTHGDTELVVLSDIGKSGKNTKRPGYVELVSAIEADTISVVYAYSLSRLNRSTADYAKLAELCTTHKVAIRYVLDPDADFTSPSGRLVSTILSGVAQMEREIDSERAKDNIKAKTANGEHHGEAPYGSKPGESVDAVAEAFQRGGSYGAAARILNVGNVPTRRGGTWNKQSVRTILKAQRPEIVPAGAKRGATSAPKFRLARLLVCHCGANMTAQQQPGGPRYVCHKAASLPDHKPSTVSESKVIEWVQTEAARLLVPDVATPGDQAEAAELRAERDRIGNAYARGWLPETDAEAQMAAVEARLDGLRPAEVFTAPSIDWEHDAPEAINAVLRALWASVQLDSHLLPVAAEWRVPEWRAGPATRT